MILVIDKKKNPSLFKLYSKYVVHVPLCKGLLNKDYIKEEAVAKSHYLIVHVNLTKPTRSKTPLVELSGMGIIRKKKDHMYLDVVCAKPGIGKQILDAAAELTKTNKMKYLILSAMPYIINYYRKMGFVYGKKECKLNDDLKTLNENLKHKRFKNMNGAITNEEYKKLLLVLVQKKMTGKYCRAVGECSQVGFAMTKCV